MKNKIFFGVLIGVMATGCAPKQPAADEVIQVAADIPTIGFENVTALDFGQYFNKVHCIQLESADECPLSEIKHILDAGSTLVVLDDFACVYTFDRESGKFLNRIGLREPDGERYRLCDDVFLSEDNKEVGILDRYSRSISFYDLEGKFLREGPSLEKQDNATSVAAVGDKWLLCNDMLDGGFFRNKYPNWQYSFVSLDSTQIIRFADYLPLTIDDAMCEISRRPLVSMGDSATFFKCFNDTLFRINGDRIIKPLIKLGLKKPMPDLTALNDSCGGWFNFRNLRKFCKNTDSFEGFDKIFETENLICLTSAALLQDGFYWIDKNEGKGYTLPFDVNLDNEYKRVLAGETIIDIVGSNHKELISTMNPRVLNHVYKKYKGIEYFCDELSGMSANVLPDGNPVVLIYGN